MKILVSCILMCCFSSAKAQSNATETEINKQVWFPFIQAYQDMNADNLMRLHAKDLVRVPVDAGKILTYQEYALGNKQSNAYQQQQKRKQSIAFSFENRIHNATTAYETGFYRITSTESDGKINHYYGKFTVVLRKTEGQWKIILDSDTGKNITETMFLSGKQL
ncbi:YybH family protein [Emticicia fluvialis]|uniref:YybH family protein n=1 Tax=Emticicia fluvialis TaxID=2974474 RepID=UPI0021658721|nr:DUF4440 domain-containing protein [Emticicia fluvialis]